MGSSGRAILRSTALLMVLTLLGKATGLARDVVVAWHFGTSPEMDAFLVAMTITGLMFVWFRAPVRVIFLPLFTEDLSRHGEAVAWRNASVLLNTILVFLCACAAAGWLAAPYLVYAVAPGFPEATRALAVGLTRMLTSTFVFLGLAKVLSTIFHAYQRFGRPGALSAVDNLVAIPAIMLLAPFVGIYGLAAATIAGTAVQALLQLPILWRHRAHYTPRLDLRNPTLRRMLWLGVPLLAGVGGGQLATITDRIFASLLPAGSLSALSYGHRLTYATFELVVTSLTTVLFPFFARMAGDEAWDDLARRLFRSLRTVVWIVLPISVGFMVLSEPLVRLVYHRGAFDATSVHLTAQAVFFYALGLGAYSVSSVLTFGFYSLKDTRTPVTTGLVRIGVKIGLSYALVGSMAHAGIALAESLSFLLKAALLFLLLPAELRHPEYGAALRSFGWTAVTTAAMGAVLALSLPFFAALGPAHSPLAAAASLAGAGLAGAATYLGCSLVLQRSQIDDLLRLVRSGLARR